MFALGLTLVAVAIVGWLWRENALPGLAALLLTLVTAGFAVAAFRAALEHSDRVTSYRPDVGLGVAIIGTVAAVVGVSFLVPKIIGRRQPALQQRVGRKDRMGFALLGIGGALCLIGPLFIWASLPPLPPAMGFPQSRYPLAEGYQLGDGRLILASGLLIVVAAALGWARHRRFGAGFAALVLGVLSLADGIASWRATINLSDPLSLRTYSPDAGLLISLVGAALTTAAGCFLLWTTRPRGRRADSAARNFGPGPVEPAPSH